MQKNGTARAEADGGGPRCSLLSSYSAVACRLIRQHRSTQRYRSTKDPQLALRARLREIARTRVRYGYRRMLVLFHREGWQVGKNVVYRLYVEVMIAAEIQAPKAT